jgi:glycosyltransferase involved in cell wall biosynthesis
MSIDAASRFGAPDCLPRLLIVTPVFNDWESLASLVADIEVQMAESPCPIEILVVDDCSAEAAPERMFTSGIVSRIQALRLSVNVGHQRAIAVGLVYAARRTDVSAVAVMDCDGEDRPQELKALTHELWLAPDFVHVANRSKRSESWTFRAFYWLYGRLFKILTGASISFGNFSILPFRYLRRLILEPSVWNHYAATIIKSKIPIRYVPTIRGVRYAGQSKMNFSNLVLHGLGAISVFSENVFVRILLFSSFVLACALLGGAAVLAIRMFTDLGFPNWATTALGFAALISLQAVMTPIMIAFLLLNSRSAIQPAPKDHVLSMIDEVRDLLPAHPGQEHVAAMEAARRAL